MTMLHHAAFSGHTKLIDIIFNPPVGQKDADVDAVDLQGETALHIACDRGHVAAAERLLDEGANINAKDEFKRTPLHLSCNSGQTECVAMLLRRGCAKELKTVTGYKARQYAEDGKFDAIIELLK